MAVSKQTKTREGILGNWRRAFRQFRNGPRNQARAEALRGRRSSPGSGPDQPPGEDTTPPRPPLVFGVALVAVVLVVSLVAYEFNIPQLFPMLAAGVGAIAGFWLFDEIRRFF